MSKSKTLAEVYSDEGDFASSDEEFPTNTTGPVPLEWYSKMDHVGYTIDGEPLVAKGDGDVLTRMLLARGDTAESKEFRRTVYDARNDEHTTLTDRELLMVTRLVAGSFPHPEFNAEPDYVDWFSGTPEPMSLNYDHEPKRRFVPSKWERMKVNKIVAGIKSGAISMTPPPPKPKVYMLWGEDGAVEDKDAALRVQKRSGHVPAPKPALPGHAESYHPPAEYLLSEQEMRQLEELDPEQAQAAFVPRDYQAMRRVPGYDRFVKERFERCLDLYLCPRAEKVKLNIDPESLVPRLPLPKELRPFPTSTGVIYLGHTGRVRAVSFDPSGQLLATAGDDGDVRVWDVESGRCVLRRAVVEAGNDEGVTRVAWNPCKPGLLAVASGGKVFVMFLGYSTSAFDEGVLGPSVTLLAGSTPGASSTEPDKHVEWMEQGPVGDIGALSAGEPAAVVMAIKGAHLVSDICWHCKGEFLATVSSTPAKGGRVLVHHVGRRQSEDPVGPKQKGDAQCVCFHPTKPVLFMATKTHLLVFHLVRRVLLKKMSAGVKWISSIAVHPKGDHVVLGSFDCRVAWFDLDLGSKPFRVLKYHTKAVRRVAFHKRYPLLASSSDDGRINVFHATVYEDLMRNPLLVPVKKIEAHDVVEGRGCLDLAFHPTLPWVVSCGADGTAVLWTNVP